MGRIMAPASDNKAVFEKVLACDVASTLRMGSGRNSRVYQVVCGDGRRLVAKIYHRSEGDPRDRLRAEYDGLSFLWRNGIRTIPRPVTAEPALDVAFYEHLDGVAVDSREAAASDIDQFVDFLVALHELKSAPEAGGLPVASEACFSVPSIIDSISGRLARIAAVPPDGFLCGRLHAFLDEFRGQLAVGADKARRKLEVAGLSFQRELPTPERTLSPSDVGFHNALRTTDGRLVFVDFEYFGWDDPAKTISDFILHPGMVLSTELKTTFVRRMLGYFARFGPLPARLDVVYPLWGLKWCMILLNEFVREDSSRRSFAAITPEDVEQRRSRQLAKAWAMLEEVKRSYEQSMSFY